MHLSTKNKMQMTMSNLINETIKLGGIPNKFNLSKVEFGKLLVELNNNGINEGTFTFKSNTDESVLLKIYRETFTNDSVNELINSWVAGDIIVKFGDIPIVHQFREVPDTTEWTQ